MERKLIFYFLSLFFILNVFSQQRIKDFYLSNYKENGTRAWEINGSEAVVSDRYVDITDMEAKYYTNHTFMQVKSDTARLERETMSVSLRDNVEVDIPKGNSSTKINCLGPLEMEYNKGIAVFYNKVVVEHSQGKLFCDKATVFFSPEDKKLIKIIAEGNVKIVREDSVTFAQKATYLTEEERLTFEGMPHLIYFPKKEEAKKQ